MSLWLSRLFLYFLQKSVHTTCLDIPVVNLFSSENEKWMTMVVDCAPFLLLIRFIYRRLLFLPIHTLFLEFLLMLIFFVMPTFERGHAGTLARLKYHHEDSSY